MLDYIKLVLETVRKNVTKDSFLLLILVGFNTYQIDTLNKTVQGLSTSFDTYGQDLTDLSNSYYRSQMYDILKQGEKVESGDAGDIKTTDLYKFVNICEEEDFKMFMDTQSTNLQYKVDDICESLKEQTIVDKVKDKVGKV